MFTLAHPLAHYSPLLWILTHVVVLGIVLWAFTISVQRRDWHDPMRLNLWLWFTFFLICLWLIKGQVMDNLYFHLVGASIAYLLLGAPLAILALAFTSVITSITHHASPWIWSAQFLLAAMIPLLIIALLHRVVYRWLPHRLFVYIFLRGFLVAALGMSLAMAINLLLIGYVFDWIPLRDNGIVWSSPILLGWGEGFLSGAFIAVIATYRTEWLYRHPPFTGM